MAIIDGFFDLIKMFSEPLAIVAFVLVFGGIVLMWLTSFRIDTVIRYRHPFYKWMFDQSKKDEHMREEEEHDKLMAPFSSVALWCLGIGILIIVMVFLSLDCNSQGVCT